MADLTPGQTRALQFWGVINKATADRVGTAELWQRINAASAAAGHARPGFGIADLQKVRSLAVGVRAMQAAFNSLGGDDLITGDQIAQAPWSRPLASRNVVGMWQVEFEHVTRVNGVEQSNYRVTTFTGTVPRTRNELQAAIEQDASRMARDYGTEHVDIGDYRLYEV